MFNSRYAPGQTTVEVGSDLSIRACAHRMWVGSAVMSSGRYRIVSVIKCYLVLGWSDADVIPFQEGHAH